MSIKFVPNVANAAELKLRKIKDKHNEREMQRKARRLEERSAAVFLKKRNK